MLGQAREEEAGLGRAHVLREPLAAQSLHPGLGVIDPAEQQLRRQGAVRQPLAEHLACVLLRVGKQGVGQRQQLFGLLGQGPVHGGELRIDALAAQGAHVGIGMPGQRGPLAQRVGLQVQRLQAPGAVALCALGLRLQGAPDARGIAGRGHGGQRAGEQPQRRVVHAFGLFRAEQHFVQAFGDLGVAARVVEGDAGQALDQGRCRCTQGGMR